LMMGLGGIKRHERLDRRRDRVVEHFLDECSFLHKRPKQNGQRRAAIGEWEEPHPLYSRHYNKVNEDC
jgi:hypothetical protein